MIMRLVTLFAFSALVGCVGFDTESDLFMCEVDGDCVDGFACAGHTVFDGDVISYCVAAEDAKVGIGIEATINMFVCETFTSAEPVTVEYYVASASSDGMWTPGGFSSATPVTCDDPAGKDDEACCFGDVDRFGRGEFVCQLPPEDISHAAMWVRYVCNDASKCTLGEPLALMFASGPVPTDAASLVHFDNVRTYDLDIAVASRCSTRAAARAAFCGDATQSCSCSAAEYVLGAQNCAPDYFCAGSTCSPAYYGDSDMACTDTTRVICESGVCIGSFCKAAD